MYEIKLLLCLFSPKTICTGGNNEAIKVFKRLGFYEARQKGSHVVLRREHKGCVVPRHKELAIGTLKSAIRQAGVSVDEFIAAYERR